MAAEGEASNGAILRSLLELAAGGEEGAQQQLAASAGLSTENVAQLLAAAIAQVGQSILSSQQPQVVAGDEAVCDKKAEGEGGVAPTPPSTTTAGCDILTINPLTAAAPPAVFDLREAYESVPQASTLTDVETADVATTVEVPTAAGERRPLCVKFPIELRKRIISMRKSGKLCKDIAKELKVSVSGVQKVWERFLATGMAHDRKPSTYAGRPRKTTFSQEPYSPGFDLSVSDDVFPSSHVECVATPTSATPTSGGVPPNADVIITDESEVFTEGATVEIVETTPLVTPPLKSPKKKGPPPYRSRLLLQLVEDCPLARLRAEPDSLTNIHAQNLMVSITKPLYMEYVLGHPFGKVPPSRPFEGCTSEEAEIILSDPANPVGKKLLAALGYSTKVYFNACCKPSPLFDTERILTSLPLSLGPAHLGEAMRNIVQLLIDFCINPEEALNLIPTAAGPVVLARRGDIILSSHSISSPAKLSEFWVQLYSYVGLLGCCENFVSANPPSAPCLLCHPFEHFAQSLEIVEPDDLSPTPLPLSHTTHTHLTSDLHTQTSPEVEVQVLESGTSGLTSVLPLQRPFRWKGKGRKELKSSEKQPLPSYTDYEEQNVVSDGEYEIPVLEEHSGSEVIVSHSNFLGMDSGLETAEQVEASEAAQNLALLASQVTTFPTSSLPPTPTAQAVLVANSLPPTFEVTVPLTTTPSAVREQCLTSAVREQCVTSVVREQCVLKEQCASSGVGEPSTSSSVGQQFASYAVREPLTSYAEGGQPTSAGGGEQCALSAVDKQHTSSPVGGQPLAVSSLSPKPPLPPAGQNITSEVAAVTEVPSYVHEQDATIAANVSSSSNVVEVSIVGVATQTECQSVPPDAGGSASGSTTPQTTAKTTPNSLRRSRRKITRVRRLVSEETTPLLEGETAPETNSHSPTQTKVQSVPKVVLEDIRQSSKRVSSSFLSSSPGLLGDDLSLPPAKRTRSRAVARGEVEEDEGGVACVSGWSHPRVWGVAEVAEFVGSIPQCSSYKDVFTEHLVDGETLLTLDPQMMVKLMDLKTGPALRIHRKIATLKKHFSIPH